MRKAVTLFASLALVAGVALTGAGASTANGDPNLGGFTSENVEWRGFIPFEVGTATGARIVGHYLYVTSWRSLSIYNVSKPEEPLLESHVLFAQTIGEAPVQFENEDVATNGKILIMSETVPRNVLHVWDVTDKKDPTEIATVDTTRGEKWAAANHTMSCLLGCKWLWGSDGAIVDLRNPNRPKVIHRLWNEGLPGRDGHDVTEIKPRYVLTATQPIMYLDARNPVRPKQLALGPNNDDRFIHSVDWPRNGKDPIMLAGGETNAQPTCGSQNGAFMTWDASRWRKTRTFKMLDQVRLKQGNYVDGNPPVHALGCSVHWFQAHPTFGRGGVVAEGAYENGMRFWMITPKGRISEAGYFTPYVGSTSAAYWRTSRIVYSIDYLRGFDVLKYTGPLKAK